MALNQLKANGYEFTWAESARADGGAVMRGNDVLEGTPDVLVTDSLTGNVLVKMLAAFTTGGSFESTGFGYGPSIGKGYDKLILIISRASGAPLIANALEYAAELVKGKVFEKASAEFAKDLEDAAQALWKEGIYAETGMGCTGPLVMMSEANHARALEILKKAGYVG